MFLSILLISYRDFGILIDLVVYLTEYLGKIDQSLQTGYFQHGVQDFDLICPIYNPGGTILTKNVTLPTPVV